MADNRAAPPPPSRPKPPPEKQDDKLFALPIPNRNYHRAIAYLMGRGIDRAVIDECIRAGTFYESAKRHDCVFVGRDTEGKARFACKRGISGDYKKDVSGSDKRYSFAIPSREPSGRSLFVFESPVDALAQATLDWQSGIGAAWDCFHRLSLGGVSPLALMEYIKARPEIDCISLCLDNDAARQAAAERIRALLEKTPHPLYGKYNVSITPPPSGKDYAEHLQNVLREKKEINRQSRPGKEAATTI